MGLAIGLLTNAASMARFDAAGWTSSRGVTDRLIADTPVSPGVKATSWGSFQVLMPSGLPAGWMVGGRSVKICASSGTVNSSGLPHHVAGVSVACWLHSTIGVMARGVAAN